MTIRELHTKRKACDVTQAELAKFSGLDRWRIVYAERGVIALKDEELDALAAGLAAALRERLKRIQNTLPGLVTA